MIESQKVTSYKLSKQLAELGFDNKNYTGWWVEILGSYSPPESIAEEGFIEEIKWQKRKPRKDRGDIENYYKAYDCRDLFFWLAQCKFASFQPGFSLRVYRDLSNNYFEVLEYQAECFQPQNALAKAIIEILKEKNNG